MLTAPFMLAPCVSYHSALNMDATCFFRNPGWYPTDSTACISKGGTHNNGCENINACRYLILILIYVLLKLTAWVDCLGNWGGCRWYLPPTDVSSAGVHLNCEVGLRMLQWTGQTQWCGLNWTVVILNVVCFSSLTSISSEMLCVFNTANRAIVTANKDCALCWWENLMVNSHIED
jgi:hypothetical protein